MRSVSHLVLVASLLLGLSGGRAQAKRGPKILEEVDGKYVHLSFEDDASAQAWLYKPAGVDGEEKPVDLVVALHGAGGNPKNFVMPLLMNLRDAWCLTVAGHQAVESKGRKGFMWDGSNVSYVVAFTKHVIDKYPIAKDRVIVWGHSAGGTMTLATLAKAPNLFAGGLTTASPATPDGRHKEMRLCVFLGMEDPNWAGAPSVRSFVESVAKKKKGACAFFEVEDLGHDIPDDDYLGLGFDWILQPEARGGVAHVGHRARGADGDYRHILLRTKGATGAEGVKRSKSKATKALKKIAKAWKKGRAFFPFEAACHSEDEATASCGGGIDADDLAALFGTLPLLEEGALSQVLASPQGRHLVWRAPPEEEEEEDDD